MEKDIFSLKDKTAIITGAGRGLGKAMATGLAKAGAHVMITDVISPSDAVEEIKKINEKTIGLRVDVTKETDVKNMVDKTLDTFGSIDILVNNAGILKTAEAENFSIDDWEKVIHVNLTGQFLCAKGVGNQMIKQRSGRIVNISSVAGLSGYATSVAYSASKAGVILLTKTLATEWGKYNIRVNAICPGVFATDMTNDLLQDENFKMMIKNKVALGRYAKPEELMGTIIYLASDASDYVTGQYIIIDGGWTAGL
jgi:NAD(P)-dependent dehydrogenase (short-subunit alcohol dehydrogenase family)